MSLALFQQAYSYQEAQTIWEALRVWLNAEPFPGWRFTPFWSNAIMLVTALIFIFLLELLLTIGIQIWERRVLGRMQRRRGPSFLGDISPATTRRVVWPIVILLACYTGPFEAGEEAIRPMRRVGEPLADLSGPMDFLEVQRFLDADYPDGGLHYWKSIYLEELSDEALAVLSFYSATRPSPDSSVDVWALGGALSRRGNNGGPLVSREAPYLLGIEANWHEAGGTETNIDWARALYQEMRRFSRGASYLNFPGFAEEGGEMLRAAYGRNYQRLLEVKAKYDPANLFRGQIPMQPPRS